MSRTFAYCRVSTNEQTTENQLAEIEAAGFRVEPRRAICETISGSVPALQRAGFKRLIELPNSNATFLWKGPRPA